MKVKGDRREDNKVTFNSSLVQTLLESVSCTKHFNQTVFGKSGLNDWWAKETKKFTNIVLNKIFFKFLEDFTYQKFHFLIIEISENIEKYIQ